MSDNAAERHLDDHGGVGLVFKWNTDPWCVCVNGRACMCTGLVGVWKRDSNQEGVPSCVRLVWYQNLLNNGAKHAKTTRHLRHETDDTDVFV